MIFNVCYNRCEFGMQLEFDYYCVIIDSFMHMKFKQYKQNT